MFLKQVKVKNFAVSVKKYGVPPWDKTWKSHYKVLEKQENKNLDDVFTVIGVTHLQEGYSVWEGDQEGYRWQQKVSHKVYIVSKSIGRRFKVLEEDLEVI
ncbi:hypothetical protein J5TS2_36550 [Brevibacillus halotolerans]|uniref:hypothetical protein n=1 Tax=Brevibacillus halotolerans TaxID=1507437 RepID=UPI001B11DFA3|nr:hypothetical protein [Brevibacillus halotolerans]GIO02987.1 hypothetical protein J5TS2_36550 [Brevibacillus halotolerans]